MKSGLSLRIHGVFVMLLAAPVSLWAHPGHEHPVTPPGHPMHWLIEPGHVLQGLALACITFVSYKSGRYLRAAFEHLTPVRGKARR